MKRKIVLIVLLVLPLFLYFYFSLAKHNSLFLPVVVEDIKPLPKGETLDGKAVSLKDKITILGFLGEDAVKKKETIFNLNQKVYDRYAEFEDFQMVMVVPEGNQEEITKLIEDISIMGNLNKWRFVFLSTGDIENFFNGMKVKESLDADFGTNYVFIVDKDRNLRGRKGENKKGEEEYKDAYNAFSASELSNDMTDDVKILLREYRLALKKNQKREI